jgi:hypothetical protein
MSAPAIAALNGFRPSVAARVAGNALQKVSRARGPWIAMIARSRRGARVAATLQRPRSDSSHAMSFSAVPAFTTRRKKSSRKK